MECSEKEKAVIELLKQKKRYSEIERHLHISSRDISRIKKQAEESNSVIRMVEDQEQISNALDLFEQGNTPVRLASQVTVYIDC